MEAAQKQFYRDQLRSARAMALADAEGFQAVLHSIELMGPQISGRVDGLKKYERKFAELAAASPLASLIPAKWPNFHTTFERLYDELRRARNDAVHQGTHARTLTNHAVQLTIILEDALMADASMVSQFMVRDVVEAKPWHPTSYVRQQMLKYAFTHLPIQKGKDWFLISDGALARYLHNSVSGNARNKRLAKQIGKIPEKELPLQKASTAAPDEPISDIMQRIGQQPILIVDPDHEDVLLGLITASDVL